MQWFSLLTNLCMVWQLPETSTEYSTYTSWTISTFNCTVCITALFLCALLNPGTFLDRPQNRPVVKKCRHKKSYFIALRGSSALYMLLKQSGLEARKTKRIVFFSYSSTATAVGSLVAQDEIFTTSKTKFLHEIYRESSCLQFFLSFNGVCNTVRSLETM